MTVRPGARDEGGKLNAIHFRARDCAIFGKWFGAELNIDGEDLLITKESDIPPVIERGTPATTTA